MAESTSASFAGTVSGVSRFDLGRVVGAAFAADLVDVLPDAFTVVAVFTEVAEASMVVAEAVVAVAAAVVGAAAVFAVVGVAATFAVVGAPAVFAVVGVAATLAVVGVAAVFAFVVVEPLRNWVDGVADEPEDWVPASTVATARATTPDAATR